MVLSFPVDTTSEKLCTVCSVFLFNISLVFNGSPVLVCTYLLLLSLSISFFLNCPPVHVCTCLLFLSSSIYLVSFSGPPATEGIYFGGICFLTLPNASWNKINQKVRVSWKSSFSPKLYNQMVTQQRRLFDKCIYTYIYKPVTQ